MIEERYKVSLQGKYDQFKQDYDQLRHDYDQLKYDYDIYQKLAEDTIQKQSMKIIELDKKLDMVSLIVEISEYINKCLGNSEIEYMINDIMMGILGVTYSSVYLLENRKLKLKASNLLSVSHHYIVDEFNNGEISKLTSNILNSYSDMSEDNTMDIHSAIYMPIYIKDKILGLLVVEHHIYNYLNEAHVKLLIALRNQIAICLENNRLYNRIKESSQKDGLTGLYNRNYFFHLLGKKMQNEEDSFGIVMIDVDDFKRCNDTNGHQFGDIVIKTISEIIRFNLRKEDISARYGGEEIIIYMYGIKDITDVFNRMETIRKIIEERAIKYKNIEFNATVSMGISIKEQDDTLQQMVRRADMNLYRAKHLGKNRVVY